VTAIRAVIFDLGETLVDWPDWDASAEQRWGEAFEFLRSRYPNLEAAGCERFVGAMRGAELAHWHRVEADARSGSAASVVREGFANLGLQPSDAEVTASLDGYARAVSGWAQVYPDARPTLLELRDRGYALGLLSNTWWAAAWHNADLAAHGLEDLLDVAVYTSDLEHSKPHATAFLQVTDALGVDPAGCVMVGDRPIDDISGALGVGMRAVHKTNGRPRPVPDGVRPTATIEQLAELPALLEHWEAGGCGTESG
jgi:putative hydrolase of the HAD superfamily